MIHSPFFCIMKRIPILIICLTLVASLCSCKQQEQGNKEPQSYTFTDDYGREVKVPSSPTRIVSVSHSVTEIMFALGAGDLLVGRTDFCTYPPEVEKIPSIGGITNMNIEQILSLQPELVLSSSMVQQKNVQQLEKMGVPFVSIIEKQQFDGLFGNIDKIGQLVDRKEAADSLNRLLHKQLDKVLDSLGEIVNPKTAYYVVGFGAGGNYTAGGNTFINDIITMAGGKNIASDVDGWSYSLETLMQKDPEFIIIRTEDSATFCKTQPYNRLSAVKKGNIITIESGKLDIQGPRNIEAIKILAARFSTKK